MNATLTEFREWVDGLYGVYLDALDGFPLVQKEMLDLKANAVAQYSGTKLAGVDFAYARLVKGGVAPRPVHSHKVGFDIIIGRNAVGGQNTIFIGRMVVVSVHGFWEDHIRKKLAMTLQVQTDRLKVPLMGDLRLLRNAIVHNRSRMGDQAKKLEILRWYSEGEIVSPTRDQIEEIVDRSLMFIRDFEASPQNYLQP